MSKKFKPTKMCPRCQGHDDNCKVCEGTGVSLFDEDNDDLNSMNYFPETVDDIIEFEDDLEEEDDE